MNIFGKTLIRFFLTAGMLASCNSFQSTPTVNDAEIMETAISTVSTALAETQRARPTATATPIFFPLPTVSFRTTTPSTPIPLPTSPTPLPTIPTFTPLVFTDPSIPLSERIVYYYFVKPGENPIPEGTVDVHPAGLLAPTYANETYTSDTAADLRTAVEIVLHDERNSWLEPEFEAEIVDVTFSNGHAQVLLQGEYSGEYSISEPISSLDVCAQFVGSRMLSLLTVFANPAVQTAAVSLNEDTIANLCSIDPKPVLTRAEVEAYLKENAYVSP